MIIQRYLECVGHGIVCADEDKSIIVLAQSPEHLRSFLFDKYNPKHHDAAFFCKYAESQFFMAIEHLSDIPFNPVCDPGTGKSWIYYPYPDDDWNELEEQALLVLKGVN